jgi:hypothetical protein
MSKTKISEFSTTPGNNTDINGINIAEGCAPSGINNAIRELMSDLKEWQSGAMDVYVIPQGTAAAPGIQLYGDLDTGLYGFAANQLGVAVGGASAGYFSSAGWVGNVVATTVDLTNIEVTNIKAKDGTAAITIADSTGIVSVSTVLDLTTIEVTNIKAKDGTASASIADSTGVITVTKDVIVNGVTLGKGLGSVLTNTALGRSALAANMVGDLNTAVGNLSLTSNTGGTGNTAVGHVAMTSHQGGSLNTAVGAGSLTANLNGNNNTAIGQSALGTATGSNNTAVGSAAGSLITNGNKNTIIGNYDGNQGGLDIRTASNYIVLSDGDGNPRAYWNGANATFGGSLTATTITGTQVNSDNLRLDGNTISSTDTNGNIIIAPNGTGQVQITNAALNLTTIEVTNIKAKDGTASITLADSTGNVTVSPAFAVNGNTTLGNASTDTVTVNGYMGVGGAPTSSIAAYIRNSALTGTTQHGIVSSPVGSTAGTSDVSSVSGQPGTNASAYTVTNAYSFWAFDAVKGAGSTITNLHGLDVRDLTQGTNNYGITSRVSSGTNKWNIYVSGTAANYFAGNVGIGTNSPGAKLDVNGSINIASTQNLQWGSSALAIAGASNILTFYTSSSERLRIDSSGALIAKPAAGTGAVFNEDGVDADFRVESDTQTHMLFVDAGNNRVGIGTSSPGGVFHTVATAAGAASIGGILQNADNSLNSEVRLLFAPNLSTNWGNRQAYISGVNVVGGGTATELAFGSAANGVAPVESMRIDKDGNVRVGTAALATTATNGFLYIPTCAGTPTGTPTAITGLAPMVIDSTNNKLYIYSGGAWVALN